MKSETKKETEEVVKRMSILLSSLSNKQLKIWEWKSFYQVLIKKKTLEFLNKKKLEQREETLCDFCVASIINVSFQQFLSTVKVVFI
jgi:hypothetical protein